VICDRFIDSTRVYQGALGKVDAKLIRSLERVTVGAAMPDLTFILDVPATVGLARAKRRRGKGATDRFEAESVEFHEALRKAYLALMEKEPKRCVVIDGRAPRDVVADRIWAAVKQRLLVRLSVSVGQSAVARRPGRSAADVPPDIRRPPAAASIRD
jgi:dTMP kinase